MHIIKSINYETPKNEALQSKLKLRDEAICYIYI
jgi:hypothetical protein